MKRIKQLMIHLPLLVTLTLLLGVSAFAQERFGSVTGVAVDASKAVLPDVSVTLKNKVTERSSTAKTRSDGTFTLNDVEPGRYTVVFEKQGFGKYDIPDVIVLVGKSVNVTATLKVGSVAEVVEVTGATPAIDTASTTISANVTAEEIDLLPKSRTFESMAMLSPSVNTGYAEGGYQINGASGAENTYYIDGVSTNSIIDGSSRQTSAMEYLQEVQVKTSGLNAEYGGALGGVVSAVTKSGGNTFHGEGHYYYYGNGLSTDPTKRLAIDRSSTVGATQIPRAAYVQDSKFALNNHEPGGSIGGPIFKNKLWFYTAAAPKWQRRSQSYNYLNGETASINRKAYSMSSFSKLSWDPTQRIHSNFTFLYSPQYMTGSLPAYNDVAGPNSSNSNASVAAAQAKLGYLQAENSVTGQVDVTLSSTSVLSIKGGRYFLDYKDKGVTANRQWSWANAIPDSVPNIGDFDVSQTAGFSTPTGARTDHDLTTRTYIQADISKTARFLGTHNFKFGVGTTKNINNVLDATYAPEGLITLFWGGVCSECVNAGGAGGGSHGYYTVDDAGTIGSTGAKITNFYVQDGWQMSKRLVVNAGIRFEKEIIPSFRPDIQKNAFEFGFGDKIAPRIGVSYDLLGNGKVKLSGGWGRYFDWTKFDLARGTFGGDHWFTYYRSLDDPSVIPTIGLNNMPGTNLFPTPFKDLRIPGFDTLDPGVKPMSADTMNAGVEWEVSKGMVFSGRYTRNSLNRTIEDMGVLRNGSEAYFYGNPGEGANKLGVSCYVNGVGTCSVPMPKAKRVYNALELSIARRFGSGYLFNASYVYSQLWGNYSGLQNTDEILSSAYGSSYGGNQSFSGQAFRPGGNASRAFDLDQAYFDGKGHEGVFGVLPTDRPHVFKFYGAKEFKFGTEVGATFRATSGTPVSTQAWSTDSVGLYVNGRGDMGRTPIFSQTDVVLAHTFKLGEAKRLRFEMNMQNLFNQKTATYIYNFYNRRENRSSTGMKMSGVDLRNGFDYKSLVTAAGFKKVGGVVTPIDGGIGDVDPRYGMQSDFNPGFQGRLMIKYSF